MRIFPGSGSRIPIRAFLAVGVVGALASSWPRSAQAEPTTLTPFYRATQLQGELFGMGLIVIPDYVRSPDIAFPYHLKPGFAKEIPFSDTFSINRVMGGYRSDWLQKFHLARQAAGRSTLDYVTTSADGGLEFRPDLLRARLAPYLAAGYQTSDITLALDNTPWDLATADQRSPEEGPWGRKTPPGNLNQWTQVVRHFAADLHSYLGPAAGKLKFETGVEYNSKASFAGTQSEFFSYYLATVNAIHSVLPGADFGPGEFAGSASCPPDGEKCVYDTYQLLSFLSAHHETPSFISRSLNALVNKPNPWPASSVKAVEKSFAGMPTSIPKEIHQFGLLYQPFGQADGSDPAAVEAAWEFQTLIGLLMNVHPQRVFHWQCFTTVGDLLFLNGSGFIRLVLDHYLGSEVSELPIKALGQRPGRSELLAVSFTKDGTKPGIVVSRFSRDPDLPAEKVVVNVPANLKISAVLQFVSYSQDNNIFMRIRHDLEAAGNLKDDFVQCEKCLAAPINMARDKNAARQMIKKNWVLYRDDMERNLRWKSEPESTYSFGNRSIQLVLGANEVLVIQPQ